jgi:hypothetical protein
VAALAALGVVGLANSRPYEGAVTVAAAGGALWIWRGARTGHLANCWRGEWPLPACAILGCGLAAMLYYNYRVTGNALLMPYALNQAQYGACADLLDDAAGAAAGLPARRHPAVLGGCGIFPTTTQRAIVPAARGCWLVSDRAAVLPDCRFRRMALFAVAVFLRRGRKVRIALAIAGVATAGLLLERNSNAALLSRRPPGWYCCWWCSARSI